MGRIRGFLLKHRLFKLFRRRHRSTAAYRLLGSPGINVKPFSTLAKWTHCLRAKAKAVLQGPGLGYARVGHDPVLEKPGSIPKGQMAVYVGQKDGDFQRILVPVVYFNHPLFGDLLKESEKEFGFNHPGGITIPCRISEFERVQSRIQEVRCSPSHRRHRHNSWILMP